MNSNQAKRQLRKILIRERQSIPARVRSHLSKKIQRHFLQSSFLKKSKVVAAFVGFGSEVETFPLLEKLWRLKKTVVIPMTSQGLSKTFFAILRPGDRLRKTSRGPLELSEKKKPFDLKQIDLVLVPGLAFDRKGFRLGYGGGVYDRLLAQTPRARHIGLFFSSQQVFALPKESTDQKMDGVLTENGRIGKSWRY